ncbi:unnamed protein product [Ilex paraguariensis]|uniref:Sugar phosphate transporter domain-containing protein n=1 Tax=Ilex paraguariensis TaxID=185542 RepID=A0ABC8RKN8_9AQUA
MVDSDLGIDNIECSGTCDIQSGDQKLGFRREPSFSGWCDEDGILHSDHQLENADTTVEDFDFELPLNQEIRPENGFLDGGRYRYSESQQRKTEMSGGEIMDVDVSTHNVGNEMEKYEPFDIENGPGRKVYFSNVGIKGSNAMDSAEASTTNIKSAISTVDVLKTLFFILVWYTFSTFLTLYNKTLLGDDLGRFPAPLLMNTFHFSMQAVLSKAITWFWSQRFQPSVTMSWRDYFVRGILMFS